MLSDEMKQELIKLATMATREEEDEDEEQCDNEDVRIDAQIELARKVLDDLNIKYN